MNLMYPAPSRTAVGEEGMTLSIPVVNVFSAVPLAMSSTTREAPAPSEPTPPPKIATQRSLVTAGEPDVTLTFPMNGSDQVWPTCVGSEYSHSTFG